MDAKTYQELALRTEADQLVILDRLYALGPQAMRLDNAARGLAGDAGEVSSAVMKYIEYGRPLDKTNVIEEAGDCLWRIAQLLAAVGSSVSEAMEANIRKLRVRYDGKYSDLRAAERNTEAERAALERKAIDNLKAMAAVDSALTRTECVHGVGMGQTCEECIKTTAAMEQARINNADDRKPVQDGHGFGHLDGTHV